MQTFLYVAFLIKLNVIDGIVTTTPSAALVCVNIFTSPVENPCDQGMFFIDPQISTNEKNPTPVTYSMLDSFTVKPGNASCVYSIRWKVPLYEQTVLKLTDNLESGLSYICAVADVYEACGYIMLEVTSSTATTSTTRLTTLSTSTVAATTVTTSTSKATVATTTVTPSTSKATVATTTVTPSTSKATVAATTVTTSTSKATVAATTVTPSTSKATVAATTVTPSTSTATVAATTVTPSTSKATVAATTVTTSTSKATVATTTVTPSTSKATVAATTVTPSTSTATVAATTVTPSTSAEIPSTSTAAPSTSTITPSTSTKTPSISSITPTSSISPSTSTVQPSTTTVISSTSTVTPPFTVTPSTSTSTVIPTVSTSAMIPFISSSTVTPATSSPIFPFTSSVTTSTLTSSTSAITSSISTVKSSTQSSIASSTATATSTTSAVGTITPTVVSHTSTVTASHSTIAASTHDVLPSTSSLHTIQTASSTNVNQSTHTTATPLVDPLLSTTTVPNKFSTATTTTPTIMRSSPKPPTPYINPTISTYSPIKLTSSISTISTMYSIPPASEDNSATTDSAPTVAGSENTEWSTDQPHHETDVHSSSILTDIPNMETSMLTSTKLSEASSDKPLLSTKSVREYSAITEKQSEPPSDLIKTTSEPHMAFTDGTTGSVESEAPSVTSNGQDQTQSTTTVETSRNTQSLSNEENQSTEQSKLQSSTTSKNNEYSDANVYTKPSTTNYESTEVTEKSSTLTITKFITPKHYDSEDEELKKIEEMAKKLEELSQTRNDSLNGIIDPNLKNDKKGLAEVIRNQINALSTDDLTVDKIVGDLKGNLSALNEETAKAIESALGGLVDVHIGSPNIISGLLDKLKNTVEESKGFTLDTEQNDGDKSRSYISEYGFISGKGVKAVLHQTAVIIEGKSVFLSGSIIPAKVPTPDKETYLKYFADKTVEMKGQFLNWTSVTVPRGQMKEIKLVESSYVFRWDDMNTIQIASDAFNPYMSYGLELWNGSLQHVTDLEQKQTSVALTAFAQIKNLQLTMMLSETTLSDLNKGNVQQAISCFFEIEILDTLYTITIGDGEVYVKNVNEESCTLVYKGYNISSTPENREVLDFINLPVTLQNIDIKWLQNIEKGHVKNKLEGAKNSFIYVNVVLPETSLPPVTSRSRPINRTLLTIKSPSEFNEISVLLKNGGKITVDGEITIANSVINLNGSDAHVDGKTFTFYFESIKLFTLTNVDYELKKNAEQVQLHILSAQNSVESIPHDRTEVNFDGQGKMFFVGGTLMRNETDGIVLLDTTVQVSKDFSAPTFDIIPQSLLTQKSYERLKETVSNIDNFLKNNSESLTDEELHETTEKVLDITSSLLTSLKESAKSPLSSDTAINLLKEKENYNDIFNILPENPDDIRYVEEMSEDEWAAEATRIAQNKLAKELVEQMLAVINTLSDTIANRKIEKGEVPFMIEFKENGAFMILSGGTSEYVLSKTYDCESWEVKFPQRLQDLNVFDINENETIRADIGCYNDNLYNFVEDFEVLVQGGCVDVKLKTAKADTIIVKDTKRPIVVVGKSDNEAIFPMITLAAANTETDENRILDFRSFILTTWNASLIIEVQFQKIPVGQNKFVFLGYQSQPGPRVEDHEDFYKYDESIKKNSIFIPAEQLINMTGIFMMGIGTQVEEKTDTTVIYEEADKPEGVVGPWQFKPDSSEFQARVFSKGCYAYNPETNRVDSSGIMAINTSTSTHVTCHSNHLTAFSIGLKSCEVASKYSYEFLVDVIPKNVQPIILIVMYTIFLLITFYNCCTVERLDRDRGEIRHMKDNHPADEYMYILCVHTGFRQFSSSQSKICFNITGDAASEMGRMLETMNEENEQSLKWGTCSRFLMTTHWSLGNLKYLRLWIEKPGEEQAEAWYCTKVVVYDVQTKKTFIFPIHSWLGRANGDGETERLSQENSSINICNESMSFHNILEQISYISMFLGGTGLSRARLERDIYILSIWLSLSITTTVLYFISKFSKSTKNNGSYNIVDALIGAALAVFLTVINMVFPFIAQKTYTSDEKERVNYYTTNYDNYVKPKGQWHPAVKAIMTVLIKTLILFLLIINSVKCFSLSEQFANIFTRRFIIMLLVWIFIVEPLKGFLICMINIRRNSTYQIITRTELSFLPIKNLTDFHKCPEEIVDDKTGSNFADLSKLRATKDNRMRDEVLFNTVREMIFLMFTLIIFSSLTYLLRDRFGFYYHHHVKHNFDLETTSTSFSNIKSIDDFWKWADSSLVNGLTAKWPDSEPAYDMRGFVNDKASRTMGTGIIRQVRSVPLTCDFVLPSASSQSACVGDIWNVGHETTAQFDPSWLPYTNGSYPEYTFHSSDVIQSYSIMGQLGTYNGGGYTVSLQGTATALRTRFERLRNESWIDKETRAVFVELSLFNAQVNYFSVLQLVLEIPRTRFCLPTVWVESMRLIRGEEDELNKTIEYLYICYCVIKFALEFFCIIHDRFKHLGKHLICNPFLFLKWLLIGGYDLWQTMDFLVGVMSIASVITYCMKTIYVKEAIDTFLESNGNVYINLSKQRDTELLFSYSFAIVVFFVSCKLMKILRFNHRIGVLADTLESATTGITDYGKGFLCVLNAFTLAMMHLLGNTLDGYYSYIVSLQTLVSSLLGKLAGGKVYDISLLGSTYFLLFMFLGTVLLLNVFVMIIMYEFELVRTNADRLANNYEIIEHISYKVKNECGMLERSDKVSVALRDQYRETPLIQRFLCRIYLAIYRTNRLHNMNRLNRQTTREAKIESVPDCLKNATAPYYSI